MAATPPCGLPAIPKHLARHGLPARTTIERRRCAVLTPFRPGDIGHPKPRSERAGKLALVGSLALPGLIIIIVVGAMATTAFPLDPFGIGTIGDVIRDTIQGAIDLRP
jgi:hypothetical protein